ncbi:MAG: efflux RND transporter periplasmic adaptor subunit [Acidobacteria bacterium]|nr:efflux RND transporter periplasmic adaptor subunit [Acidobacteriota bacterium]
MLLRTDLRSAARPIILFSVVALCSIAGCKTAGAPPRTAGPQGALPVQVVTSVQQNVPLMGNWVATTDGYINAQIQPQVSGYLIRQNYKEGSEVHKGQVLFEIDPRPLQAVLDQTKAAVAQAEAQLQLATINVKRDTPLAEAHAIAQSQLDNDVQTQAADKAAVASAQASMASAQLNVGFTQVRSLIDGVAGQAMLQVGSLVNPSSVLTSVSQLKPIKVYFYISEQEYLELSAQAKSRGKADLLSSGNAIPLKLTLSNNQVFPQTGHIIFIDRSVSAQTGSLRLAAEFANPGNLLRPGQFGRVSAETSILHNAIIVPQQAVSELQGLNQIIVVGADNIAHIRTVQLGPQIGQNIVINSGLNAGEQVVTEGNEKVKDGMKLMPQPEPFPTAAPSTPTTTQGN